MIDSDRYFWNIKYVHVIAQGQTTIVIVIRLIMQH